jgi:hypothetical protein
MTVNPVYEKQYIRFASTFHAPADKETPGAAEVTVGEFRVVHQATFAGGKFAAAGDAFDTQPAEVLGVNQALIPTAADSPQSNRAMSVAESGLLLVEVAPSVKANSQTIAPGTALLVDPQGRAATNALGATGPIAYRAVTKGGKTPMVREYLSTGGRDFVLVSFD